MTTDESVDLRDLSDALREENIGHRPGSPSSADKPDVQRAKLSYPEQVAQLQSMFPTTDAQKLDQVLAQHQGNMEAAIPSVLELSDPDFKPTADDRMMQTQSRLRYPDTREVSQQQWDPSQLRYSPRVPRGRADRSHLAYTSGAVASTPPPVPMRPSSTLRTPTFEQNYANSAYTADGVTQHDTKKMQEDLKRFTENGIAKVGTTISNLRRKAQTAMQKLEQERQLRAQREQMQSNIAQSSWATASSTLGQDYDQDPLPVQDTELDKLMHSEQVPTELNPGLAARNASSAAGKEKSKSVPADEPNPSAASAPAVPAKSKTQTPLWGQRYASSASRPASLSKATVNTMQASNPSLSWADVGMDDAEDDLRKSKADRKVYRADQVKKDAQQQIQAKLDESSKTDSRNDRIRVDASNTQADAEASDSEATHNAAEPESSAEVTPSKNDSMKIPTESESRTTPKSADSKDEPQSVSQSARVVPESESDEDDYVHNPFDDDD